LKYRQPFDPSIIAPKPEIRCEISLARVKLMGREDVTHHLRVTCPFWTRFILNPTVGMELRVEYNVSDITVGLFLRYGPIPIQDPACDYVFYFSRQDILNGEFASLDAGNGQHCLSIHRVYLII
jgi:hypothetical protein